MLYVFYMYKYGEVLLKWFTERIIVFVEMLVQKSFIF